MKKFLVLPLVLLSFCVFADERIILGSFEGHIAVEFYDVRGGVDTHETSTLFGLGARLFNFKDEGLYLGTGFKYRTGARKLCYIFCDSYDASRTVLFGEIGSEMGRWTPFIGMSFHSSEVDSLNGRESEESWGLNVGFWLDLDTFKLRGTVTNLNDGDYRAFSIGRLFQRDNNFVIGFELGSLLDSDVHNLSISFQIGKSL